MEVPGVSESRVRERRALCGICAAGCGVIVTYDDEGRIAGVRPDENSEIGILCKLGEHTPEIVYSQDRVLHPLKRVGPKGTYEFERISWDEAYAIIVQNLTRIKEEHGPKAAAIYTGSGSFELSHCDVFQPKDVAVSSASSVLFPYGSPNTMGVGALCYVSFAMIAPHVTMGRLHINTYSDFENADLIVVWGTNPATDFPPLTLRKILAAKNRGAEVVVIDPRRTKTVDLAGAEWVPIRPGTDGALALGLCNVLIGEELYDEEFVRNWTHGFPEFTAYVQHFRPEVVEEITGVPAETVLSLARRITAADGATWAMYTGLEYSDSGVQAIRAAIVLWALAGKMDVPGGRCFSMLENTFPINRSEYLAESGSEPGDRGRPVPGLYDIPAGGAPDRPPRIRPARKTLQNTGSDHPGRAPPDFLAGDSALARDAGEPGVPCLRRPYPHCRCGVRRSRAPGDDDVRA